MAGDSCNGKMELLSALSGEMPSGKPESIMLGEVAAGHLDPAQRRAIGLGFVPEERLGRGAVPALSLAENALLTRSHCKVVNGGIVQHGLIPQKVVRGFAGDLLTHFEVKRRNAQAARSSLSG